MRPGGSSYAGRKGAGVFVMFDGYLHVRRLLLWMEGVGLKRGDKELYYMRID